MADLILWRRGTAEQWTTADPVLAGGEPGYETDTGRHKIGDGVATWSALPYFLPQDSLEELLAARETAAAGASRLVVNVKDPAYGAVGDGVADDTAAIQRAIDATALGGVCYLPRGTYLVGSTTATTILSGRSMVSLAGDGPKVSVLKVAEGSTAPRVLDLSRRSDVSVRDLGFDAGATGTLAGVHASGPTGHRNVRVTRCRFASFMPGGTTTIAAAVYTWTTDGVTVEDSEFVGCGRAITIDQPDGAAHVRGNRIEADPGQAVMATGILVRRSSGFSDSEVVVSGNVVSGARLDPGGVGAEGHGIAVYRCRDVQVVDNHCTSNGRGVLVSDQSFGAVVRGNTCVDNNDAGIRVEPEIAAKDVTVGSGATVARGVVVMGNVCRDNVAIGTITGANSGIGIAMSYAAGSTVSGNLVHHNSGGGIFCDSDRVTIVGNVVHSNWRGYTADPAIGRRAGIRLIAGTGCTVVGNQCFDNQAEKTQHYGLSMSTTGVTHVVHGNNFTGNSVGDVWGIDKIVQGFFGVAPVVRPASPGTANGLNNTEVLNNLVQSLRALGLVQ
jgi:parallel beta-helix repeat protein